MRNYTTQMDAARKGILTPEIETVAKKEHMPVEKLMQLVAEGKVAICANKKHTCLDPEGVGSMLRTKINVNLGVSRDCKDYDIEMQKVMSAVNLGAEAIMDLSSHGNTQPFRQKLTHECPAMIGTVPVYDSVIHYQRDLATLTAQDFIDVVRLHAEDGVDFVTLHCGITRKTIEQIKKHKRKMNIVSRGGSLVFAWMCMTGEENPFYEHYDEILDICEEYDVTISLGDACRPGCLADATDVCQIEELVRLGELTKRAWDHNVQVMVEGPGHVPLDQVAANMKVQQSICMGAPFYVLGPLYDSVIHYQRDLATLTAQDFIDVVRLHAEDGVDFVTLHCGITRKTIEQIKKHKRKMNIVSRGGSLVFAWMCMTGEENPFYEHYDEILDICEEYDVTISLGDACRPGCLADATDVCQIEELVRLGELTKRAWDHNVQVMVEGPGHVPLDQVAANMKVQQSICMGAPFYVLGPLVTDIAPGYDHITAAIGGAVAAMSGAAFLCYVTPAEHLALPNVDDTKQGIIASKIAAHAADIAKGIPHARDIDDKMADARRVLDWDAQYACALDPETAKAIRDSRKPEDDHSDTCSMCGKFCAVRSMNKALAGEYIDIL